MKLHGSKILASRLMALLIFVVCSAFALPAEATHDPTHENDGTGTLLLTTLTVGGLATTVGGVFLALHFTSPKRSAVKSYVRHNALALHEDLTLGAGPTIDDLAAAFGVPREQVGRFGRALRSRRATLLALIGDGQVDDARAGRIVDLVEAAAEGGVQLAETFYLLRPGGS